MKTRKYKDNQQRKNFVQNESKIFLTQYFKKIEKVTKDSNFQNPLGISLQLLSPSVAAAEAKLAPVGPTKLPNATRSGAFSGALKPQVLEGKTKYFSQIKSLEI